MNDKDLYTKKLNIIKTLIEIRKKIKYENNINILY